MSERFLHMLGLAQRAYAVRSGAFACEQAIREGHARLVVMADDASPDVKMTLLTKAQSRGIRTIAAPSKTILGKAIGKGPCAALVVTDAGFGQSLWAMSQETGGGESV